jgi:nickel-dependent lactate racemase
MPSYTLPYGKTHREFLLPAGAETIHHIERLAPRTAAPAPDPILEVERALSQAFLPAGRVGKCAIAINDRTRPAPHDHLLPPLLRWLEAAGIAPAQISLIIAAGTHPVMAPAQFAEVVPAQILERYRVSCHDSRDPTRLSFLGKTSRGTPIWIHREFMEAELRIVVGVIGPHQFVGFSGGVKSAAIGLAGYETVTHNHSMMTHPLAQIGCYEDNPCRQDIEEIGRCAGVHFALNAIVGEGKRIIRALAGDPIDVMLEGISLVRSLNQVAVRQRYDLMIVSPGGHPKDVNLYQSQKALAHAALVTRPGGTIVIAAACPDGTGSQSYEEWVTHPEMNSHEAVIDRFTREGYRIGPHKAFQISRDASRFRVLLHSEMRPEFVQRLLLTPAGDLQKTIDEAVAALGLGSRIGIMPAANDTIPVLSG